LIAQFDPIAVLGRPTGRPKIHLDRISFRLAKVIGKTSNGDQKQPALYLLYGGDEVGFARGELGRRDPTIILHLKIFQRHLQDFAGRGIGSLLALAFGQYVHRKDGRSLISSRSNSAEAFALWMRLVKHGLAVAPDHADLRYLLNNAERQRQGLPDKFKTQRHLLHATKDRFQMRTDVLANQEKLSAFVAKRMEAAAMAVQQ